MEKLSKNEISDGHYIRLYKESSNNKITISQYRKELFQQLEQESVDQQYFIAQYYYFIEKQVFKALEAIEKAIEITETRGNNILSGIIDKVPTHLIYSVAGQLYADTGDMKKSQEYYNKAAYKMIQLKSEFEGDVTVYSFRSVNVYSLSDLIENAITVLHPKKMNDPFDSLFIHWASEERMMSQCKNLSHIPTFCKSFQYFKIRSFVGNKNLTSNTRIVKKVKMWSHYADNHAGFCIKYKLSANFIGKKENSDNTHWYLKRINYMRKANDIDLQNDKMNTTILLATKAKEWRSEEEVRLIYYNSLCEEDFKQIPLDDDSKIEAVYFGYKCSESNRRDIMRILGEDVLFYKMVHDFNSIYQLRAEKIKK